MLLEDKLLQIWKWAVLGAPVWWFLGFNLFVYHFFAFLIFFLLVHLYNQSEQVLLIPRTAVFLVMIAGVYLFSIVLHASSSDPSRMIAACYNFSFWLMGAMLIITLSNIFTVKKIPRVLAVFDSLALIIAVFTVVAIVLLLTGSRSVVIPTPLYPFGKILGYTPLVEHSLKVDLLQPDWFVSLWRPRYNVFSPYPTAAGGIIMICMMMMITSAAITRQTRSLLFLVLFGVCLTGLLMTLSRMSAMAFLISTMCIFVVQKQRSFPWLIVSFLVIFLSIPFLQSLLGFILGAREGSNETRLELYRASLDQLRGTDWILGLGVKPRDATSAYPLGSHSSYVSMLFKCGILGFVLFSLFQITLLTRWYRLKQTVVQQREHFLFWRGLGLIFVGMAVWVLTEDLDAPQLLAFLYFSCIGLDEGLRRSVLP